MPNRLRRWYWLQRWKQLCGWLRGWALVSRKARDRDWIGRLALVLYTRVIVLILQSPGILCSTLGWWAHVALAVLLRVVPVRWTTCR